MNILIENYNISNDIEELLIDYLSGTKNQWKLYNKNVLNELTKVKLNIKNMSKYKKYKKEMLLVIIDLISDNQLKDLIIWYTYDKIIINLELYKNQNENDPLKNGKLTRKKIKNIIKKNNLNGGISGPTINLDPSLDRLIPNYKIQCEFSYKYMKKYV